MSSLPPPPPGIRSMDSKYYIANQKSDTNILNPYINHYATAETLFQPRLFTSVLSTFSPTVDRQSTSFSTTYNNTDNSTSPSILLSSPSTQSKSVTRIQQDAAEHEILETAETLTHPARNSELLSVLSSLGEIMNQLNTKHSLSTNNDNTTTSSSSSPSVKDTNNNTRELFNTNTSSDTILSRTLSTSSVKDTTTTTYTEPNTKHNNSHLLRESIIPHSNAINKISRMGNAPVPSRLIINEPTLAYHLSTVDGPINDAHNNISYYPSQINNGNQILPTTIPNYPSSSTGLSTVYPSQNDQESYTSYPSTKTAKPTTSGNTVGNPEIENELLSPSLLTMESLSIPTLPQPLYINGDDPNTIRLNTLLEPNIYELQRLLSFVLQGSNFMLLHKIIVNNNHEQPQRHRIHLVMENDLRTLSWKLQNTNTLSISSPSSGNTILNTLSSSCTLSSIQKLYIDHRNLHWTIEYTNQHNILTKLELIAPDKVIVQDWISALKILWEISQ